jgi:hypothetical protein
MVEIVSGGKLGYLRVLLRVERAQPVIFALHYLVANLVCINLTSICSPSVSYPFSQYRTFAGHCSVS